MIIRLMNAWLQPFMVTDLRPVIDGAATALGNYSASASTESPVARKRALEEGAIDIVYRPVPSMASTSSASVQNGTTDIVISKAMSHVPVLTPQQLRAEYADVGKALSELKSIEAGDEWQIDEDVFDVATKLGANLLLRGWPAPHVYSHGPKSVIFNWEKGRDNFYLTISADKVSVLMSGPDSIKARRTFTSQNFIPERVFPRLIYSAPGQQVSVDDNSSTTETFSMAG